KNSWW
ncbi:hypothetical protein D039_5234B, partial [Vibrio parahaemolyticus EKP-028]